MISEIELSKDEAPNNIKVEKNTVVLVVGSVVATGRSFLKISQSLRNIPNIGGITYVSILNRFSSQERQEYVRANLVQGSRSGEYLWHWWQSVHLPDCSDIEALSFAAESRFLRENADALNTTSFWSKRLKTIEEAEKEINSGLDNRCFLPTFRARNLALRDRFALYSAANRLSHSEVFTIVVAYLGSARSKALEQDSSAAVLIGGTLLDPSIFTRFNDGVLQAALLRACHPSELDYSTRRTESADVRNVIISVFKTAHQNSGEAAGEFLIALAMRRIRLWANDYLILRDAITADLGKWPAHYRCMWDYLMKEVSDVKPLRFARSMLENPSQHPVPPSNGP